MEQLRSKEENGAEKERNRFWIHYSSLTKFKKKFLFYFLAAPRGLQDHSSLTRDQTRAPDSESTVS